MVMVKTKAIDELARRTPGRSSHAIEAFSRALLAIPTIIVDNAGLDSAEMIAQFRVEHQKEESSAWIDVISGSVGTLLNGKLYRDIVGSAYYVAPEVLHRSYGKEIDIWSVGVI